MASQLAAAREAHLQASSEALMFTSPSISAYVQTQTTSTSNETSKTNTTKPQICSCGRQLLLGWNSKIKSFGKRTRNDRLAGKSASKSLTCSICNAVHIPQARHTTRRTKAPQRTDWETKAKTPFVPTPTESVAQSTPATAEPATSAARKRSRNKKSSLQAMLAERKSGSTSSIQGFGLGLGDFMK